MLERLKEENDNVFLHSVQKNAVVLMRVELIKNWQAHVAGDDITESSYSHSSLWLLEENGFPKLLYSSKSPEGLSVGANQGS